MRDCGGNLQGLHDALNDCLAVIKILEQRHITFENILSHTRSVETIHSKTTNPLLRAKLITEAVAKLMPQPITCESWLSEAEVANYLTSIGAKKVSIVTSIAKRKLYIK